MAGVERCSSPPASERPLRVIKISPTVDAALIELTRHGASAEVDVTRRHVKIAWATDDGRRGLLFTSKTPSDFRAAANARSVARRVLRGHDEQAGPPTVDISPPQRARCERMRQTPHPPRAKTIAASRPAPCSLPPLVPWSPTPEAPKRERLEPPEGDVLRYLRRIENEHCRAIGAVKASHGRERFLDVALAAVGRVGVFTAREDSRLRNKARSSPRGFW